MNKAIIYKSHVGHKERTTLDNKMMLNDSKWQKMIQNDKMTLETYYDETWLKMTFDG